MSELRTGTLEKFADVLASLVRGSVHDRHTIARTWEMTVASADRHIRAALHVPGVVSTKQGKRLSVRWSFTDAIKEAGL